MSVLILIVSTARDGKLVTLNKAKLGEHVTISRVRNRASTAAAYPFARASAGSASDLRSDPSYGKLFSKERESAAEAGLRTYWTHKCRDSIWHGVTSTTLGHGLASNMNP